MPQTQPDFLSSTSSPAFNDTRQRSLWRINGALVDILNALDSEASGAAADWQPGLLNVTASATPEVVGGAGTTFRTITFWGQKAEGTDNGADVFIRRTQNGTGIELNPGLWLTFTARAGETFNLADFWVKVGVNAEGVLYAYSS